MNTERSLKTWLLLSGLAVLFLVTVMGLAWLAGNLWPRIVDLDALQLLGANLIGVLLAAFFALETERFLGDRRREQRQAEAERERRSQARHALSALEKVAAYNRDEVDRTILSLKKHPQEPVFSRADPDAFRPILTRVVEKVDSLDLIRQASTVRHQLQEFNRMAEAQLELYLLPDLHPRKNAVIDRDAEKIEALRDDLIAKTMRYGERVSVRAEELRDECQRVRAKLGDRE